MSWKDIIEFLSGFPGGFLGGATLSALITFNVTKTVYARSTKTIQKGNRVGGDMVGGDYHRK